MNNRKLMNNKNDMQTIIRKFYQCNCNLEFINDNSQHVIIRTQTLQDYQEINPVESQKILNLAGFKVKHLKVTH